MKTYLTTLIIFILCLVIPCDKDYEGLNVNTPTLETQVVETKAEQNARITGLISSNTTTRDFSVSTVDELGNPLPDVAITMNNINYSLGTIANAVIEDVTVNDDDIFIIAEKQFMKK